MEALSIAHSHATESADSVDGSASEKLLKFLIIYLGVMTIMLAVVAMLKVRDVVLGEDSSDYR